MRRRIAPFIIVAVLLVAVVALPASSSGSTGGGAQGGGTSGSATNAKALILDLCTRCHDVSRIKSAQYDAAGWQATVERMRGKGTEIDTTEASTIVEFLAGGGGPSLWPSMLRAPWLVSSPRRPQRYPPSRTGTR